jgi:D-alanyl-lipoteichoic acid acyltransferase DltB (MBOAT superfamily)
MSFVPVYIFVILAIIGLDYVSGILIENSADGRRRLFLVIGLVLNILILVFFKYYNFLNENIAFILKWFRVRDQMPFLNIIIPLGLSFQTFQALSYLLEVYRGKQKAEKNFGFFMLYQMMYPRLIAGPIERPQNLLPQFAFGHKFDFSRLAAGLQLIAWGFFKKLVIADRLAQMVNNVYDFPANFEGISLVLATVFYSFQVYLDFSGYTDIALGTAEVMGFKLTANFNRPYLSKSVAEFWQRWHITLSGWLRDYLYLPVAYSTSRKLREEKYYGIKVDYLVYIYATLVTFLICGLWHGSSWNFVIWGCLHGVFLIVAVLTSKPKSKLYKKMGVNKKSRAFNTFQILVTFSLVTLAWVFFRATSFGDAIYILRHMFTGIPSNVRDIVHHPSMIKYIVALDSPRNFFITLIILPVYLFIETRQKSWDIRELLKQTPVGKRYFIYYFFILVFIFFGVFESARQFIYFQF